MSCKNQLNEEKNANNRQATHTYNSPTYASEIRLLCLVASLMCKKIYQFVINVGVFLVATHYCSLSLAELTMKVAYVSREQRFFGLERNKKWLQQKSRSSQKGWNHIVYMKATLNPLRRRNVTLFRHICT